ncbi:hypothetical protein BKA70DRAFT_1219468 [Coprinopsis sp. MPI-PUGE-AT-0042]|nr:hypothetical protein BKA70DRAFT_1219468 [Coprinopsis sp. MPI-PUGE-AT-0042]
MASYEPSEAEWNAYGTMFAASRFSSRLMEVTLWGIQTFMVASGTFTFLKIPKQRRKGHLRFIMFSVVLLVTSSISLAVDICWVFNNLFNAGPDGKSYIENFRKESEPNGKSSSWVLAYITVVIDDVTIAAADILLLWRCSILWSSRRWVIILPSLACAGSIDTNNLSVSRITNWIMQWSRRLLLEGPLAVTSMTAQYLAVSVNVMATGLILFKLWRTWSAISKACPNLKRSRMYTQVAATVIESAAPFTIFGICYATTMAINYYHRPELLSQRGVLNCLVEASGSLFYSFSMIIYRVLNGQSWKNTREGADLTERLSMSLRFETPTSGSISDIEAAVPLPCPVEREQ